MNANEQTSLPCGRPGEGKGAPRVWSATALAVWPGWLRASAWLPLLVLPGAMVLVRSGRLQGVYASPSLVLALDPLFSAVVSLLIAYLAGREFLVRGTPSVLLLGCGAGVWGGAGLVAAANGGRGADLPSTLPLACAWLSGLCHLTGALLSLRPERSVRAAGPALAAAYAFAAGAVGLVVQSAIGDRATLSLGPGILPQRLIGLGSAIALFVIAAALLGAKGPRPLSPFSYWYALALAMIPAGLFGVAIESARGNALGWLGRATLLLGGVYMLVAVLASLREARGWGVSLEAGLRESEARYRALFSGSLDAIFLTASDGQIVAANPVACALFGMSEQELRRVGRARLVDPDDARLPALLEQRRRAGGRRAELRFVRRDGTRFDGELSSVALEGEGRAYDIIRDITERKRAEAELERLLSKVQRHSAELDAVFESMAGALVVSDMSGRIVRTNPAFDRTFELPAEWRDPTVAGRIPALQNETADGLPGAPEDAPAARALRGETVRGTSQQLRRTDGRVTWLSTSCAPIRTGEGVVGAVLTFEDVTDRRNAEQALRESEQRLEVVIQASGAGYYEHAADLSSGKLSAKFAQILGFEPDEMQFVPGWSILYLERIHEEDRVRVVPRVREFLAGRASSFAEEYRVRGKDGAWRWVRAVSATVQRDAEGRPTYVAGFLSDIDDRKRAEIERERLLAALREADQRKNEFLAMLSHELRNPLAPIRNSLFVLGRATPGGPRATQALAVIDRQVEHMVRLVDDLLDVTRITRGKIRLQCEPMDLSDLVRRVAEDHRILFAQSGVDLIVDVAPEARVIGDRTRLTQVVGNLLQNAAKFTPRGGSTTLSLMSEHGAQAILNVRDSGDGIAPAILPRLFTPFTQADTSLDRGKGGLGLGLSLVKSLVEMHGGSVAARSPGPGKGAEFRVTLPLEPNRTTEGRSSSGPLVRGLEPNRTAEGRSSSGPLVRGLERWPRREAMVATAAREGASLRVLLIEDNGDAAASLRVALEMGAHVVEIAGNGPDGIAKARSFRPDVVVCDIGLPGMDGYEVARAMRADADLSAMLLIALTGYAGPKDVARSREAGFDHHLAKPPDLATLRRLLGQVQRRAS